MSEDHEEMPLVEMGDAVEHHEPVPAPVMPDMSHDMLVASVVHTSQMMDVTLPSGDMTKATVPVIEVELVDESGKHGSRTMRFVTHAEREYALAKYHAGEMITVVV